MGTEGHGVLLYLNQEGRGIGLANKMRAYSLQDQGFDTVEANHRLGFEDDERDFRLGSDILKSMGFSSVRLLTNNPRKVEMMAASGIEVAERVALKVGGNRHNHDYLATTCCDAWRSGSITNGASVSGQDLSLHDWEIGYYSSQERRRRRDPVGHPSRRRDVIPT